MSETIFTRELLDQALLSSGLVVKGSPEVLRKGRDKLSYLRKSNRKRYGTLLFTFDKAETYLKIINTRKKLDDLLEVFS